MLSKAFDSAIIALSDLYTRYTAKKFNTLPAHADEIRETLIFAYQLRCLADASFARVGVFVSADDQRVCLLAAKMFSTYIKVYDDKQSPITYTYTAIFKELFRNCSLFKIADDDVSDQVRRVNQQDEDYSREMSRYSQFRDHLDHECPGFTKLLFDKRKFDTKQLKLVTNPTEQDVLGAYAAFAHQIYKREILPRLNPFIETNTNHVAQESLRRAAIIFLQHMNALQCGGYFSEDTKGPIKRTDFPRMLEIIMKKTNTNTDGARIPELFKPQQLSSSWGNPTTTSIWVMANDLMGKLSEELSTTADLVNIKKVASAYFDDKYDFMEYQPNLIEVKISHVI